MAWPFKAGTLKVVVTYGFEGQAAINVHFVLQNTPVTPVPDAVLVNAANSMRTAFDDNWKAAGSVNAQIDSITATDWSREGGNQLETTLAMPIVGTVAGNSMPNSVAVVVSQRTNRTGRSFRGRNYISGIAVSQVLNNTVDAALITAYGLLYSDWRTALTGQEVKHVVYSLVSGGAPRTEPEATPITSTIVDNRVDTQRRRLPPML